MIKGGAQDLAAHSCVAPVHAPPVVVACLGLCSAGIMTSCMCVQAHHVTRQVEYRGDVISLTEALVGFPAGGQVLLSDGTYQRIYGRLHTLNLNDRKKPAKKQGSMGAGRKQCLLVALPAFTPASLQTGNCRAQKMFLCMILHSQSTEFAEQQG